MPEDLTWGQIALGVLIWLGLAGLFIASMFRGDEEQQVRFEPPPKPTCASCRFQREGNCHRFPMRVMLRHPWQNPRKGNDLEYPDPQFILPVAPNDHWCGEYAMRLGGTP